MNKYYNFRCLRINSTMQSGCPCINCTNWTNEEDRLEKEHINAGHPHGYYKLTDTGWIPSDMNEDYDGWITYYASCDICSPIK